MRPFRLSREYLRAMENGISVRKRGNFRAILYIVQMIKTNGLPECKSRPSAVICQPLIGRLTDLSRAGIEEEKLPENGGGVQKKRPGGVSRRNNRPHPG